MNASAKPVVIVTGAAQGIGRATAERLRRDGQLPVDVDALGCDFLSATDELWSRTLEVNLMGTVRMCRAAIPHMRRSQHPLRGIVNFTSQAAKTGGIVIGAPYSAAKAAVLCLTKTLAGEFSPEGIRVNAVAPGVIDTAFLDGVPGMRDRGGTFPIRRIGQAAEVASVVGFLMSADASYLTGEIIDVNGGLYMD